MGAALQPGMTLEEFLVWEERQETKYEFDGANVRAMVGVSDAHAFIQTNLIGTLFTKLRGGPCRVWGSDFKLQVMGRIRYPDAFISCQPLAPGSTFHDKPVVVFEIVSPSSQRVDRFEKSFEYGATESVQAYVIVQQTFIGATLYHRRHEDWVGHEQAAGAVIDLPGTGVSLHLDDLYEGVAFPA